MKKLISSIALILALGIVGAAQKAPEPEVKAAPVEFVNVPAAPLHRDLERNRLALAADVACYTVSVEIDYDRDAAPAPRARFPGAGGADLSDPFFRYDLGPFSGLVVATNHVLISDRCLGSFTNGGAADTVLAITVTLPNGDRWPAKVVGRQQQIDLALLEVSCDIPQCCPAMKVAKFPEGEVKLERGQQVFVIGRGQNPLRALVNDGIVSAIRRETARAFQLDARIGNSTLGAPVVNDRGALVGVVTMHNHEKFGQASGVSYAAYMHEVREGYSFLKAGKFLAVPPKPQMGVNAVKKYTEPDKPGLEVGQVTAGSGADRAGIRNGDVILNVDGADMFDIDDLRLLISKHKVGDTLTVKILREEKEQELKVTLGTARN